MDGVSATALFTAFNTPNSNGHTPLHSHSLDCHPKSFHYLLTALKIGQVDGVSVTALLTAFNGPNSFSYTLLDNPANNFESFQYLLTALKIGQVDGVSATVLLTALNTPNRNGRTPLDKLAGNLESFEYLLTALKIGEPNGASIQQLLEIFTLEKIARISTGNRQSLFSVIAAKDPISLDFLNNLNFREIITAKDLDKAFSEKTDGEKNLLQEIQQDNTGKYMHFIWLINALFPDILPSSLKWSGKLKHNLLQIKEEDLSDTQKTLLIPREELDYLLNQEYPAHRNKAWYNSFWKRNELDDSKTIQQLKALMTDNPSQPSFNLMEIRAKLHRTSIGASKDSGTDFILNALMEKFNCADRGCVRVLSQKVS